MSKLAPEYDFVIVGGGPAACAAARALVLKAGVPPSVLVIERGPESYYMTKTANTWPQVLIDSTAVQLIRWTSGQWGATTQLLGGGTGVNGGLWAEENSTYFARHFDADAREQAQIEAAYTELNGLLATPASATSPELSAAFVDARLSMGLGPLSGHSRKVKDGTILGYQTFNTSRSPVYPRNSADVLIRPLLKDGRIHLAAETMATRIRFDDQSDGSRATGVQVESALYGGPPKVFRAKKAVVVACGAVHSPALLLRSGVGPTQELAKFPERITPRVINEEVGRNFIDRPVAAISLMVDPETLKEPAHQDCVPGGENCVKILPRMLMNSLTSDAALGIAYEAVGGKQVATSFAVASGALVDPSLRSPLTLRLLDVLFENVGLAQLATDNAVQVFSMQENPSSRGTVGLDPNSWDAPPLVHANLLSTEEDLNRQIIAVRQLVNITLQPAWDPYKRRAPPAADRISKLINPVSVRAAKAYMTGMVKDVCAKLGASNASAAFLAALSCTNTLLEFTGRDLSAYVHNPCADVKSFVDALMGVAGKAFACLTPDDNATPLGPSIWPPEPQVNQRGKVEALPLKMNTMAMPCPPASDSTAAWTKWVQKYSTSSYHYFGTASVGKAVDAHTFEVIGASNLHVIDASTFPVATHANPQASIYAVGQYAALKLIEKYQL